MAIRTNVFDVKAIITTSMETEEVHSYIVDANTLVNSVLSGEGLSEALLGTIEKWVTAHLIAVTKARQPQYKKIGDAAESYPKLGLKMESSTYGQTAIAFDTSGKLAKVGKQRVKIEAVPSFDDSPIL